METKFFNDAAPVYKQEKLKSDLEILVKEKMSRMEDVIRAQQEAIDNLAKWCSALDMDYREYQLRIKRTFLRLFWLGVAGSLVGPAALFILTKI